MEQRIAWNDLPATLRRAIEARTGPITAARTATAGENSPLAAIVATATGMTFVKGIPSDHRRVVTQEREAAVAPLLVRGISPALRWSFDEEGWNVLGYDYVVGRHADYSPGSGDIEMLVPLMRVLGEITVEAPNAGVFKLAEDRWKTYVEDLEAASAFSGTTLTHTDWAPHNVLVAPDRVWLIDWAWPTLGAAWTDPAHWIIRLIAAGHTAKQAERQALRLPAFAAADPAHIDLFAAANVRLWNEIEQADAGARSWTVTMAQAAREWSAYRHAEP
jgi:hypothetical protein